MNLTNGLYKTAAGSTVTISGSHAGVSAIEFDWLEEGGCIDCSPEPYEFHGFLVWNCDECGGGCAELTQILDYKTGN